jgi:hypothetical protein
MGMSFLRDVVDTHIRQGRLGCAHLRNARE